MNRQSEVFDASVSWLTHGSSTPALVLSDNNTLNKNVTHIVDHVLGGYLSSSEQQVVSGWVSDLHPGDVLDLSSPLGLSTNRAVQSNVNFVTGFANDLKDQSSTTTFWENPSAHISNVAVGFAEHTGQNWELFFTDSKAPAYMRDQAADGVLNDMIALASLYPAGAGAKVAQGGVGGNLTKAEALTGESDFYNNQVVANADLSAAKISEKWQGEYPYWGSII